MEKDHKDIYQIIDQKIKQGPVSALMMKTVFSHLIRLPETYKLDFIQVHLPELLKDNELKERDELLRDHYRHYVSIPCLSGLLAALKESKLKFDKPILQLLEHISNLQLVPGPSIKEREQLEKLHYDLIRLTHKLKQEQSNHLLSLTTPEEIRELAEVFYEKIMSSFISDDDDNLVTEDEFVEDLKENQIKSKSVQEFAKFSMQDYQGDNKNYLVELGKVLKDTILSTYHANYCGIFNGDRDYVLQRFVEAIEDRVNDCIDKTQVSLSAITSSILAVVLELLFNSGIGTYKQQLEKEVFNHFQS